MNVHPLDPVAGPPIRFAKVGNRWHIGNRPTRLAAEIIEDGDTTHVIAIDPVTWEIVAEIDEP